MNRRNRLRRAALVLALVMLAAIVTGVAASATKTAIPKQLTGTWSGPGTLLTIRSNGKGGFAQGLGAGDMEFSRVAAHRLAIRGGACWSATGIYHWKVANRKLTLTKIHDACKSRVAWLPGTWRRRS